MFLNCLFRIDVIDHLVKQPKTLCFYMNGEMYDFESLIDDDLTKKSYFVLDTAANSARKVLCPAAHVLRYVLCTKVHIT